MESGTGGDGDMLEMAPSDGMVQVEEYLSFS